MDSSWNANPFAHTDLKSAGNTLLGDAPCYVGSRVEHSRHSRVENPRDPSRRARPDLFPADLLTRPPVLAHCGSDPAGFRSKGAHETHEGERSEMPLSGGDLSSQADTCPGIWWLVHTLPRQEKALASALYARDIAYYLPLVIRKSLSRGRTRVAQVTLFPGYLFVCGSEEDRLNVLKTNRALTVRPAPDGERLRADLRRFYELISVGAPLLPEARLIAGERVRVKAGPFRDHEGIVIRRNGKTRLLIAIDYLQQGASLEVDDCLLERI